MRYITMTVRIQFDADNVTSGDAKAQARQACDQINGALVHDNEMQAQIMGNPWQITELTGCDECGEVPKELMYCPDGAEICHDCFNAGAH